MLLNLTTYSTKPIHTQIVNQILNRILEKEINPGEKLESVAKLSRQQHINKGAVVKAYKELEKKGLIKNIHNGRYAVRNLTDQQLLRFNNAYKQTEFPVPEKERIEAELEAAKEIQNRMMPKALPENDLISVAAYSTISDDVGGDFYDFFEIAQNKYGVLIGDASGKGLPAAMLISQIQAIIKSDLSNRRLIKETLFIINTFLKSYSAANHFATLFFAEFDLNSGILKYANAGHNYPIIVKYNGKTENLKTTGPALGIVMKAQYEEKTLIIEKGDLLFLFTDGLSESMDNSGNQYGEERIEKTVTLNKNKSTKQIIKEVRKDVYSFSSNSIEKDDTTMLVIKRKE